MALHERFGGLDYDAFRRLAGDESLSLHERAGFPDEYRAGREALILEDVEAKLPVLRGTGAVVADIGCGPGPLATRLRERCAERGHTLILVDSPEMLAHHPDGEGLEKVAGRFPDVEIGRPCDAVLVYSVLQYAFADASVFAFADAVADLLAPGGRALIGDIPNASMRRRFLASEAGRAHHRAYTGRDEDPPLDLPPGEIDDAVVAALVARARVRGVHAWVLPQDPRLPMANRREDLLLERP